MSERDETSELRQSVRKILLENWDPVGIRGFLPTDYGAVCDEYDIYICDVIELLAVGSVGDIENFLLKAEKEQVPSIRRSNRSFVAAKLLYGLKCE